MGAYEDVTGKALSKIQFKATRDDTFVHQLNRIYCVVFFIIFAIFSGSNQYVSDPISCWCPKEFKSFHVSYVNAHCWIQNTYRVPWDAAIPSVYEDREDDELDFYQWVPLVFTLQAVMFMLPRIFWKIWQGYTGLNIVKVLTMADRATIGADDDLNNDIYALTEHLKRWIDIRDSTMKISQFKAVGRMRSVASKIGLHNGNYMALAFMFTGLLYCGNAIGQFIMLDRLFLALHFRYLGHDYFNSFSYDKPWIDEKRFPRVTFCDFDIRQLANLQRWTVQCTLPINMFNEKMFLLIWFLLIIMAIVNFVYFVYNLVVFSVPFIKFQYIAKHLESDQSKKPFDGNPKLRSKVEKFVNRYLKMDGVFVLWFITQNTSQTITGQIVERLWNDYRGQKSGDEGIEQ